MAFTVHFANTSQDFFTVKKPGTGLHNFRDDFRTIGHSFRDKISMITPVLSVQADILYPNALASVTNSIQDVPLTTPMAVGCKGNQIDNPCVIEPRVPVPFPVIMYPTGTRGPDWAELDMCARPVLNWETYVKNFRASASQSLGLVFPNHGRRRFLGRTPGEWKTSNRTRSSADDDEHEVEGENGDSSDNKLATKEKEINSSKDLTKTVKATRPRQRGIAPFIRPPKKISFSLARTKQNTREVRAALLHNPVDIEAKEVEIERRKIGRPKKPPTESELLQQALDALPKEKLIILEGNRKSREEVNPKAIQAYKNQPALKVRGTWNYLYGGHGACDWSKDLKDKKRRRNLFIANGTKLRMIALKLKPAVENPMLSYKVDSVWEEPNAPLNPWPWRPARNEALDDLIFQIKTHRMNLVAAQRGRSIHIYEHDGPPTLICSIPNVCYGTKYYIGWEDVPYPVNNPLLMSFDLNYHSPSDMVTMDENHVIQFLDFAAGKSVLQVKANKVVLKSRPTNPNVYPQFTLNETAGVAYAGRHPQVIYQWVDSQIYLYDRRGWPRECTLTTELLNLRHSPASFSWSDQEYFKSQKDKLLTEYVSCVRPSKNPLYYYVGTTSRVLFMDVRVPKNPIIKFDHGMRSAAAYLDVLETENFEIVVGGSQRLSETFCAAFDTTHVSCLDRPECKARYPILHSYPRHLHKPRDFLDFTLERGARFQWESDHVRAKSHVEAWPTGLCVLKSPRSSNPLLPPPFILFQGNSFGDAFCQEWDQKPARKTEVGDERLVSFTRAWRDSMEAKSMTEFKRESVNSYEPTSLDIIMEAGAHALKHSKKVRTKLVDPYKPSMLTYHRVRDGLPPLATQIDKLRTINSRRVQTFLDVWTKEVGEEVENDYEAPVDAGGPASAQSHNEGEDDEGDEGEVEVDQVGIEVPAECLGTLVEVKEEVDSEFVLEAADTDVEMQSDEEEPNAPGPSGSAGAAMDFDDDDYY